MSKAIDQTYTPMMQQYLEIKKDYSDFIVFFRLGDFYEMFFTDALVASRELEIVLTGRDAGQEERVPMCGVPYHAAKLYIDRLISKNYKVAIVEQVEDPKLTKTIVKREVVQIVTPGTLIDEGSIGEKENNYIVSVNESIDQFILAYADLSTGETSIVKTPKDYELLSNEITNISAREIVVSPTFSQKKLRMSLEQYSLVVSIQAEDQIPNYYKNLVSEVYDKESLQAYGRLLQYMLKTQRRELMHLQKVHVFESSNYLRIDHNSIYNLELIQTSRFQNRVGSLFGLLDQCSTAMGSRYLKQSILRPLVNMNRMNSRYSFIESLNSQFILREEIKQELMNVYDLERIVGRISFGTANGKDLLQLAKSIKAFVPIHQKCSELQNSYATMLCQYLPNYQSLSEEIISALVDNPPLVITEGGMIRPGYHLHLDALKSTMTLGKDWILQFELQERQRTGIKKLKVAYNRVFGYYIEVTKGQLDLVKDEFGYERKQTLSNSERYITQELKEKESLILGNEEDSIKLEYEIFVQLRDKIKTFIDPLQQAARSLSEIDMMVSLASIASSKQYIRPIIHETSSIEIIEGRHPVVETLLVGETFISNDLHMPKITDILLITGPNMSGKSTYMRQLALIIIMAQIGSFIPAKAATLPIFDQIFTRIGASDDLSTGKSTFMVEMLEVNHALKNATPKSLILFDEIGRGTATYDGMALAQAIIEYAHYKVKCKILFSTHYHELTYLEDELPALKNVHVMAKEEHGSIVFLHKVAQGPTDRSYGIHVAKLASLPKALIKRANEILEQLEQNHGYNVIKPQTIDLFNFEEVQEEQVLEVPYQGIITQLRNLNIDELTPLKAMNILADIIDQIQEE
ncbi:MAG: DNA mismatch repair protein MutS [Candidatus Izemoplasmatales bacterium]|nr:DNA mismatch repair protein MutS [bacterium]MDZ4195751.1 DNA mismatch repair protein MutS [Candidatus Izemoplasmatales bacterium]